MTTKRIEHVIVEGQEAQTAKAPAPKHPLHGRRCRVGMPEKFSIPIVGGATRAFDAVFDWDKQVAIGEVEGREVVVGVQMCAISFYKEGETR